MDSELYDSVKKLVEDIIDRYEDNEMFMINNVRKDLQEHWEVVKGYRKRMDEIEQLICSHAIGVQNVYNELIKVKRSFDTLNAIPELMDKLNKFNDIISKFLSNDKEIESLRDSASDVESFMSKYEYEIGKLRKIRDIMQE